jgi:MoaA/NifB/PqqE/SkfB family radical SAM enzyme
MMIEATRLTFPERFPLSCQWEITCRCNLRCVMCYTDCFNRPEKIRAELSTEEILRIMDELAAAGCLELCLTGGEPLARPDFFELYAHAKANGFLVTVFTNGTLITEEIADRFAMLPPYRIEISLHGLTDLTFDTITQGKGSFHRCKRAIGLLLERKLVVVLKTTAMTLNENEILDIKAYVASLEQVRYKLGHEIRFALDGSGAAGQWALSDDEWQEIYRQDPALWEETCRKQTQPPGPCQSGQRRFHIDAYGQLQLCSGNRQQSYDLRQGSFEDGFYQHLPQFACSWKRQPTSEALLYPIRTHA